MSTETEPDSVGRYCFWIIILQYGHIHWVPLKLSHPIPITTQQLSHNDSSNQRYISRESHDLCGHKKRFSCTQPSCLMIPATAATGWCPRPPGSPPRSGGRRRLPCRLATSRASCPCACAGHGDCWWCWNRIPA